MEKKTVGQKVKGHFKKYKVKYVIAGGVVVGAGLGAFGYKLYSDRKFDEFKDRVDGLTVEIGDLINSSTNTTGDISAAENAVVNVSMGNNILQIIKEANRRGHAGTIVTSLDDPDLVLYSYQEAADYFGVSKTTIANACKGKTALVKGHRLIKLGTLNADEMVYESQK